jgi:hypothetical protein
VAAAVQVRHQEPVMQVSAQRSLVPVAVARRLFSAAAVVLEETARPGPSRNPVLPQEVAEEAAMRLPSVAVATVKSR